MKLLIVLGMQEHQADLTKMFKVNNTPIFSKVDVEGFKTGNNQVDLANWFGDSIDGDMSVMYIAFVQKENAESMMEKVKAFNSNEDRIAPLHAFQLPVEKFI
jgi:hypothetical protein